jgi:hypothetical protein
VSGCSSFDNQGHGIRIYDSFLSSVESCAFADNTGYGFYSDGYSTHDRFVSNSLGWNLAGNGYDDSMINEYFDREGTGNAWSDYEGERCYHLDGSGKCVDVFPERLEFLELPPNRSRSTTSTTSTTATSTTSLPDEQSISLIVIVALSFIGIEIMAVIWIYQRRRFPVRAVGGSGVLDSFDLLAEGAFSRTIS